MLHFQWYPFQALTVVDLYEILKLRSHVFVVEQKCAYLDVDGKDAQALHLLGKVKGTLVAYLRLFPPSVDQPSLVFGRVVVAASMRKKGYGRGLMHAMLTHCDANFPGIGIKCSAQYYLKKFYESYGLVAYGDIYDEDGMPHIAMRR